MNINFNRQTKVNYTPQCQHAGLEHLSYNQINFGSILGFILTTLLALFLLLGPEHTPLSLYVILNWIIKLPHNEEILAIGLIPIYLSILIFGGGTFGGLIGHKLQHLLYKRNQN